MIACFSRWFVLACLSLTSLAAQIYDCRTGLSGVSFYEVFRQVGEDLDYNADGEIVRAPGKKLVLTESTRIAFFHYVARVQPSVSIPMYVRCDACNGKGGERGLVRDPNNPLDLGQLVDVRCAKCSGAGGGNQLMVLTVTHSGPLPPLPPSPKLIVFRESLTAAREGSPKSQLAVAKAYHEGRLVPRNLHQAREWYSKAGAQGEREALAPLASLYLDPDNPFHDRAFGLALSAVADPASAKAEGADFVRLNYVLNDGDNPASGLLRHLQALEAGLLVPRIARGLEEKSLAESMLAPDLVRRSFPAAAPLATAGTLPARSSYVRGLSRYFGFGFAAADPDEGLRLIEAAACKADPDALLLVALHFDNAKVYPASIPAAWAFYAVASDLGAKDSFIQRRSAQLAKLGVAADWVAVPEILRGYVLEGKLTPATLRELADLSRYRMFVPPGSSSGATGPYAVAATQETPLSAAHVFSRARTMLNLKLNVVSLADDDVSYFRKCWDDGQTRFYSVSGQVTFMNAGSVRETTPYTVCFKMTDPAASPTLLYCAAGSMVFGEYPAECLRRP